MEMIKTQDLAFTYPGTEDQVNTRALRGVDVTIERGSFVVILGHNGSGKSTLAKTFNAVLLPSGGKVYVEGMDTMDESLLLEIRRRVGMVFQNPDNQIVANVVEEDVAFAPENLGVPSAEIRKRVDDALEAVGMTREQVYICNIVKCRPPQNRVPEPDERSACMPYLRQQVALVRPKVIVCLGSTPTRALLGDHMRITRDRGVWQLKKGVWFMPTYHPAALLRDLDKKRPAWEDFKAIRDKLIELGVYERTV